MRLPLPMVASAFLLGLLALQARPACAMDTPGQPSQAAPVLQHILSFQDDPDQVYLLGGAFNPEPGALQVQINGHLLAPGQVALRSGYCLAVARNTWEAWVAPGAFTLVEVSSGGQHAMKLQRGGPALQVSVRELLDRPAEDARSAGLQALVRRAFPQQPTAASSAAAGPAPQAPASRAGTAIPPSRRNKRPADAESTAAPVAKAPWGGRQVQPRVEPEAAAAAATPHGRPGPDGLDHESVAPSQRYRLTPEQTAILVTWFKDHVQNPRLNPAERQALAAATGLDERQVLDWFGNARKRHWVRHPTDPTQNAYSAALLTPQPPRKPKPPKAERHAPPRTFNEAASETLKTWASNHISWPFLTLEDRKALARATHLTQDQILRWMVNYRIRYWEADAKRLGYHWPGAKDQQRLTRASDASAAQPDPAPVRGAQTEPDPPTDPEGDS